MKVELDTALKIKIEKLQGLMKYPLKFGRQENLTTYFSDYATQSKNKRQKGKGRNIISTPSLREMTSESPVATEA